MAVTENKWCQNYADREDNLEPLTYAPSLNFTIKNNGIYFKAILHSLDSPGFLIAELAS